MGADRPTDSRHRREPSKGNRRRPYDYPIGAPGIAHGATAILTSNLRHIRGLFRTLDVVSATAYLTR